MTHTLAALRVRLRLFMITPAIEQRSGLGCAIYATCGRLQSVQVVRENDNTSHTFLDKKMEQKCNVPAGIHDGGLSSGSGGPVVKEL